MKTIFSYIETNRMILPGQKILAAVSGGADSVCLLLVLKEYQRQVPFSLEALHVEHGLRGEESVADMRFVEELCADWEIPCHIHRADVAGAARREGLSLEEAGRKARYGWFAAMLEELGADAVAVAHQMEDQAETVLHHLMRGSGLSGLSGMAPVRGRIIRPLLGTRRRQLEELLTQRGIPWRTDRTNLETAYTRNRIRLELLPWMEERVNAEAAAHIAAAADRVRRADRYFWEKAAAALACLGEAGRKGARINAAGLLAEDELIQEYVLRLCLERLESGLKDVGAVHIEKLKELAAMGCGRRLSLPDVVAWREREWLCLSPGRETAGEAAGEAFPPVEVHGPGVYTACGFVVKVDFICPNLEKLPEKTYTKWLSYDTIQNGITLRTRRPGDYLIVNRDGGRKRLKDYFIDEKIPRRERESTLLAADGSHILWVVGYRISEAAKVTTATRQAVEIQVRPREENSENPCPG